MFKPFKFIFKIVRRIIIFLLILVFLLYKNVTPPLYSYDEFLIENIIDDEIERIFSEDLNKDLEVKITEDFINNYILDLLEDYFESTYTKGYLYEEGFVKIQGLWTEISDNGINIYFGAHFNYKKLTFKTAVRVKLIVVETDDGIISIKLEKLNLGKISFKWLVKIAPNIFNIFSDFNEFLEESEIDFVSFDQRRMTVSLDLRKIIMAEDLEGSEDEASLLLNLLFENNLIDLKLNKDIIISLGFSKILDNKDYSNVDDDSNNITEEDIQKIISNKFIAGALSSSTNIKLSKKEILNIFSFYTDGVEDLENIEIEIFKDIILSINNPVFDLEGNDLFIIFPASLKYNDMELKTNIKSSLSVSKNGDHLLLGLKEIILGEVVLDKDIANLILSEIENDILVNNKIIINDFFKDFDNDNLQITKITIENNYLVINYKLKQQFDVLDEIRDLDISEDFKNNVIDLAEDFINGNISEEDFLDNVDDLLNTLDPDDLDKILGILDGYLDDNYEIDGDLGGLG